MDKKILMNYIYNVLYQMVRVILPFILVPYTYAHITPAALGIYDFAGAIMQWFILFGILGVNIYGNREIAKIRNDKDLLNKSFFEIFYMQVVNMLIATICYFAYIQFTIKDNLLMYQLTGLTMFATMFDITWFFFGVEDFKKVSIRNVVVKIIGVSLIMLLCKKPEDLWIYILINVCSEFLGQIIMFTELRKYISFTKVSLLNAYKNHFKATFQLFIPTIAISVYTMLDSTMIGYLYNEEHVSFYKSSMNIIKMFLYFITSIGAVVLPRVTNSYYNDEDGDQKARSLIQITMKVVLLLAFPMCFGMMAISNSFISWYLPTTPIISSLIIIGCPIIIFISMSNVTGTQYMVPTGMYKEYSASVIAGACMNLVVNFLLIPKYGAYGAVIGSLIAEITVTVVQFFLIRNVIKIELFNRSFFIYLISSLVMAGIIVLLTNFLSISKISTLIEILVGVIVYFGILLITKEEMLMHIINKMLKRS